jgi:hypothetical protein
VIRVDNDAAVVESKDRRSNWCQDLEEIEVETDRTGMSIDGQVSQPPVQGKEEGKSDLTRPRYIDGFWMQVLRVLSRFPDRPVLAACGGHREPIHWIGQARG